MSKGLFNSAASTVLTATAPATGPVGIGVTFWTWLAGHDIAWFVGISSLILIWLQIRDKLFPRKGAHL